MKNIIIAFLILCCSTLFAAEGPFSSGSKSIPGSVYYSSISGEAYYDTETFEFTPSYTICSSDGLFVGGTVRIRHVSTSDNRYGDASNTQWQVGGILEKYFTYESDGDGRVVPFFKSSLLMGQIEEDLTLLSLIIDVGGIKMISEAVGAEFGVKAAFDNYSSNGGSSTGVVLQVGFGFKSFLF